MSGRTSLCVPARTLYINIYVSSICWRFPQANLPSGGGDYRATIEPGVGIEERDCANHVCVLDGAKTPLGLKTDS